MERKDTRNVAVYPERVLSLCSGVGMLDLGFRLAFPASRTLVYCERESYAASVLVARMEDAALDPAPIWDDVTTFDGRPWRGLVDAVIVGFPCTDISDAGRRAGIYGPASGLFFDIMRIVREVGPRYVFLENVAALANRGLATVLATLAEAGFHAEWGCFTASEVGAPHRRDRIFILAYAADPHGRAGEPREQGATGEWRRGSAGGSAGLAVARNEHGDARGSLSGELRGGRPQPSELCGVLQDGRSLADAQHPEWRAGDEAGGSRREGQDAERQAPSRAGTGGETVADADGFGRREAERGQSEVARSFVAGGAVRTLLGSPRSVRLEGEREAGAAPGPVDRTCRVPLFPPGRDASDEWRVVLDERPFLAPATTREAAAQSVVQRLADGAARGLAGPYGDNHTDQLFVVGNGCVPLTAALAARVLWHRAFGGA